MALSAASPDAWVDSVLAGTVACTSSLVFDPAARLVLRRQPAPAQVQCISGGGSGHEPAHAGFVGAGMLSAAVCGGVFSSPPTAHVLAAIKRVAAPHCPGVLLVVKNYTGDRLNFGLAAELGRVEGVERVAMCIVGDDVALPHNPVAGRRGLAGTLLVHKVAGAAAAAGCTLDQVAEEARAAASLLCTVNVVTETAALPGAAHAASRLPPKHYEFGGGIHNEPGALQRPEAPVESLVAAALARLTDNEHVAVPPASAVTLLISGLGSSSPGELALVTHAALAWLSAHGFTVHRVYSGTLMTSLNSHGFSLTLLRIPPGSTLLARLDAPTDAPSWPASHGCPSASPPPAPPPPAASAPPPAAPPLQRSERGRRVERALRAASQALVDCGAALDRADAICGDGDCGRTLAGGARALLADIDGYSLESPAEICRSLAAIVRRAVGGTSGVLLDILFSAAQASARGGDFAHVTVEALASGVAAVERYGGAKPGSRTMLDAMLPAVEAARAVLASQGEGAGWEAAAAAAAAARLGAQATCAMVPAAGRASYRAAGGIDAALLATPDPGASAVAALLSSLAAAEVHPPAHPQLAAAQAAAERVEAVFADLPGGYDLDKEAAQYDDSRTYGEIATADVVRLLVPGAEALRFVDLGSGIGKLALAAGAVYRSSLGVENCPERSAVATTAQARLGAAAANVELVCGDMLEVDLRTADVVFAHNLVFSRALSRSMEQKLDRELAPGVHVFTVAELRFTKRGKLSGETEARYNWAADGEGRPLYAYRFHGPPLPADD